jgi:hypothetical protein
MMTLSPVHHLLLLIAFNSTRSTRFTLEVIRESLVIASEAAFKATNPEEFKSLLEKEVESGGQYSAEPSELHPGDHP